ncbi:hypothetical protein MRX96_038281 [Rhipicephalus microplus]
MSLRRHGYLACGVHVDCTLVSLVLTGQCHHSCRSPALVFLWVGVLGQRIDDNLPRRFVAKEGLFFQFIVRSCTNTSALRQ